MPVRRREKRITLRVSLDESEAVELYEQLQQVRKETGKAMNTLALEALKAFMGKDSCTEDEQNARLRNIVRSEIREALREWSPAFQPTGSDGMEEKFDTDDEDDSFDSLAAVASFNL